MTSFNLMGVHSPSSICASHLAKWYRSGGGGLCLCGLRGSNDACDRCSCWDGNDDSFTQGLIQEFASFLQLRNPVLSTEKSKLLAEVCLQCYNSLLLVALRSDCTHRKQLYEEVRELLVAYLRPYVGNELLSNTAQPLDGGFTPNVLFQKYQLSPRQRQALTFAIEHERLTIQNFQEICPEPWLELSQKDIPVEKRLADAERPGGSMSFSLEQILQYLVMDCLNSHQSESLLRFNSRFCA